MDQKRRRLSRLCLKKHFRKSLVHDQANSTIPNKSLSIISISSTDSDCSSSDNAIDELNPLVVNNPETKELDNSNCAIISLSTTKSNDTESKHLDGSYSGIISPSPIKNHDQKSKDLHDSSHLISPYLNKNDDSETKGIDHSDCGIISPSPIKNQHLKCLSTGKKKSLRTKTDKSIELNNRSAGTLQELSLVNYDGFKTTLDTPNGFINSTMLHSDDIRTSLEEKDSNLNGSGESVHISIENDLDDIYGDSWRPFKEKVLPKSEKKPPKQQFITKRIPATERKMRSETYKNPYVENEKLKSNCLLENLQRKRLKEIQDSPLMRNLKLLCDPESSGQSDLHSPRTEFNINEDQKTHKNINVKSKLDFNLDNEKIEYNGSDKENPPASSYEKLQRRKLWNGENVAEDNCKGKPSKITDLKNSQSDLSNGSLSSDEYVINKGGGTKVRKKTIEKIIQKYVETSDSNESSDEHCDTNEKTENPCTKKATDQLRNKKVTKKTSKTKSSDTDENLNRANKGEKENKSNKNNGNLQPGNSNIKQKTNIKKRTKSKLCPNFGDDDSIESNDSDEIGKNRNIRRKALTAKNNIEKYFSEFPCSPEINLEQGLQNTSNLKRTAKADKEYSFLASLSSNIPDRCCHPSALVYKVNFKNTKEELAKKLFSLYNENIFDNLISNETPLEWNARMLCTAGYCYSKKITHRDGKIDYEARIVLSLKVLTNPERLRDTLVHEMCHAAAWVVDKVRDNHGKFWKAWVNKAKKAFPELPPITTCHNYEITSKYIYRCTGCGYSIRRHRKSLDIERKRCGYCHGKFEILINKVNKKGEQKLIPADTPKKEPKGFALFVKENYSKYDNKNSAEIMRLLSKEFKELKVH